MATWQERVDTIPLSTSKGGASKDYSVALSEAFLEKTENHLVVFDGIHIMHVDGIRAVMELD
jgi:hypothetical protein